MLAQNVKTYALRGDLLSRGDRILVAVSGGPDSVALLHILRELQEELGLHLEIAHLQHGIRGEDARADARFVAQLAERFKLPLHLKEIDLPRLKSNAGKGNLEALARAERYGFFAEIIRAQKLDKAATGHTQDDQAETVLMWMLRGSGMKGLGGMAPCQELRVTLGDASQQIVAIRPLLEVSKSEILKYLAEKKIDYRVDQSNRDAMLVRNWLRSELLPKIERRAGGGFSARLSRQAALLRDEDALLAELAQQRYEAIRAGDAFNRSALLREPAALQRRILRLWIEQARGHLRGLDFIHIDALLRLIADGPAQSRLAIPGGWELVREYETLKLEKLSRELKRVCYDYPLVMGTSLRVIEAGVEFQSERIVGFVRELPRSLMEAVFDARALTGPLSVRNLRRGDRFQPLGMTGHKKIKELFIENKVPLSIRIRWPLLVSGDAILWIPGYGRSEVARVTEKTEHAVRIKAAPVEG